MPTSTSTSTTTSTTPSIQDFVPVVKNVNVRSQEEKAKEIPTIHVKVPTDRDELPATIIQKKRTTAAKDPPKFPMPWMPWRSEPGTPGTWRGNTRVEDLPPPYHKFVGPDGQLTGVPSDQELRDWIVNHPTDYRHPSLYKPVDIDPFTYQCPWVGHEQSEGNSHKTAEYLKSKREKIIEQTRVHAENRRKGPSTMGIMVGVKAYINGYLRGTTDLTMRRRLIAAGGEILFSPRGATHILTSDGLGHRTDKYLARDQRKRPFVVQPDWVYDSILAGKKLPVTDYEVIDTSQGVDGRQMNLADMFKDASKGKGKDKAKGTLM